MALGVGWFVPFYHVEFTNEDGREGGRECFLSWKCKMHLPCVNFFNGGCIDVYRVG